MRIHFGRDANASNVVPRACQALLNQGGSQIIILTLVLDVQLPELAKISLNIVRQVLYAVEVVFDVSR